MVPPVKKQKGLWLSEEGLRAGSLSKFSGPVGTETTLLKMVPCDLIPLHKVLPLKGHITFILPSWGLRFYHQKLTITKPQHEHLTVLISI